MIEEWKPTKYEGYFASNLGKIKSIKRGEEKILCLNNRGKYLSVSICVNKVKKSVSVHRIIAETFLGESDLVVNHKDKNKKNNQITNLEFCTQAYNNQHKLFGKKRGASFEGKCWRSRIRVKGKFQDVGYFQTKEEAQEAFYNAYLKEYNMPPWHKEIK